GPNVRVRLLSTPSREDAVILHYKAQTLHLGKDLHLADSTRSQAHECGDSSPLSSPRRRVKILTAVGLLFALVGVLFGGQIIRFVTNQGELVVVVDDPTIEIKIRQNGVEVQDKTSQRKFTLTAVEGEIEVLEKNGIKRTTKQFELTRGGTTTVKVTLDELADLRRPKDAVAAVNNDPTAIVATTDPDRRAAEWVLSIGGTIKVRENGKERSIAAVGDLSLGAFELTAADLTNNQKVTDVVLAHFKDCKNLASLKLGNTQLSDAGLANLKDYENVTDLDLGGTRVSDAGLPNLEDLPRLARLDITNTRISWRGYEQLHTTMPSCWIIWFEANWSVAEIVLSLGGSVVIGTPGQPESRGVKAFADLPLDYFQVRRVSLAGVAKASNEKANTLGKLCERMSCLRFVEFDRLESLDLLGITALNHSSRGYSFLADIRGLEELSLAKAGMNDVFLAKLPKLPALKRLVLDGNVVRGPGLTYLRELPELTDVSLGCSTLRDLSAKYLVELKQVKRLSLAGSGLTDAGIKHLAALTGLETLDLRGTKATAAGVAELQAALPKCRIEWGE
ncbi:MAG TPA: hypothetical protein VND64_19690, partial [Pirellulales bacterium]|nr:hypothetical protein [Pirellulales bacterium]